jgi:hypothetical protein
MELFDFVLAFADVIATSFNDRTHALQVNVAGIGSYNPEDDLDNLEAGEVGDDGEAFGALGVISRPLDPEVVDGKDFNAEVICARTDDGLTPIAWRDLRLFQFFPEGMPKGRVALVGYGGGFHSLDLTDVASGDRRANIHVIYCPYDFTGLVAGKAHAVILDPTPGNESISIAHGEGWQMSITAEDGFQFRTPNDATYANIGENEITLAADKIWVKAGQLVLGAVNAVPAPPAAFPVALVNPASPSVPLPSTNVWSNAV